MIKELEKQMFEVIDSCENIFICTFFGSFCLVVLDKDFNILNKFWGEEKKIFKCFNHFKKTRLLHPSIISKKKLKKKEFTPFVMDIQARNSWFD